MSGTRCEHPGKTAPSWASGGETADMKKFKRGLAEIDSQFEALIGLEDSARESMLADLRNTDPDREALLRRMLDNTSSVDTSRLRSSLGGVGTKDTALPQIPDHEILGELGRGGMATVYEAWSTARGVSRTVALKIVNSLDADSVSQDRFLREQQILATLQHPNIATLFDVGSAQGRAYMVMEKIDGRPITAKFRPESQQVRDIVATMACVVDAVQCAHERLVVHRDIKPENILVDAAGVPKLIDFGIAKVLEGNTAFLASATQSDASPLTLRYASPEQLRGEPVGVASDVYQLGLVMYRVLTGAWPYNETEEQMPLARTRPDIAPIKPSQRAADPALARRLRGDLDAILTRSLASLPAQRYRSARELHDDLLRHLGSQPVLARRHTMLYLAGTFVRRHALGAALAAALVAVLAAGAVAAVQMAANAHAYAVQQERILDKVSEIFSFASPYAPSPARTTVAEAVERATADFISGEVDDPEFHVRMLVRLATMQAVVDQPRRAQQLLARAEAIVEAHGVQGALASQVKQERVRNLVALGEYDRAIALADAERGGMALRDKLRIDHAVATILTEQGKYEEARRKLSPVAAQMGGMDAVFQSDVYNSLAIVRGRLDGPVAELETHRVALSLLDPARLEHLPGIVRARSNAASALSLLGRRDEAVAEYQALLAASRSQLGDDYPTVAKIAANTSVALGSAERFDDAYRVFDGFDRSGVLKEEPLWRAQFLVILASAALNSGHLDQVLPVLLEGVELATATLGSNSPRLAYYAEQLAWTLYEYEESELAAAAAARAHALSEGKRTLGDLMLQLLSAQGWPIAGRPDPDFGSRQPSACDRVHAEALIARQTGHGSIPGGPIPQDCAAHERARLAILGMSRPAGASPAQAQPLRSRLVQRWSAGPATPLPTIDAAQRARIREIISRL